KLKNSWNSKYQIHCSERVTEIPLVKTNYLSSFDDKTLNELLQKAKENNLDLKIAEARILQARGSRRSTASNFFPSVPANASVEKTNNDFSNRGSDVDVYDASFDAVWELDFFGGFRRRLEAAKANLRASNLNRDEVVITLLAEVTRNYIELRNAQKKIEISKKNIETQVQLVNLTSQKFDAGLISGLDVEQSKALLQNTRAQLPQLETALEATKNRINVLVGEQPGTLNETLSKQGVIPLASSKIVIETPAKVIQNRPDVKAQEQKLIAQNAMVGVAIAELFPKISLTGSYGIRDTNITSQTEIFSYGAGFVWNILNFSKIRANIDIADAKKQEEYLVYEKTILTALEDVNNQLTAYLNEEKRRVSLAAAFDANRKSVDMANNLYHEGLVDYLNVLNSQQKLYESEIALADSEADVAKNLVALNKALGGR
ncbi:MAG TPA: transporter, partial [Alphaproteobacteria bacterium]|nr:transporter [Alphaproteobacteria bacterium]